MKEELQRAKDLAGEGHYDEAYGIANHHLKTDPNNPHWLTIFCYCMLNTDKPTMGYTLAKRVTQLLPKDPGVWLNMGMAAQDLWQIRDAERSYKRALRLAGEDERAALIYVNLSSLYVDTGRFAEAREFATKALELNPDSQKARANLGFAQLACREWVPGWENYAECIGSTYRPEADYENGEKRWDGKSRGTIVVSGEQGLGDEVAAASMYKDMVRWCAENDSRMIVECDERLEGLLRRSFPGVEIYGTRRKKILDWETTEVDYAIPCMQLGQFFRLKDEDFPGEPYLVPDPDRVLQWKALFETKKKPVIGIAWRSGIPKTGSRFRQVDLEQLLPVLKSVDAHWVSLQYKPAAKEIAAFREKHPEIDLVEYPHGTLSNSYDDTVAMVAAMDQVVCMHTTVNHVAAGLGIPAWVFVPRNSQWRYGYEGEEYAWSPYLRILRQQVPGHWEDIIEATARDLSHRYDVSQRKSPHQAGNGRCTEEDPLRDFAAASDGASEQRGLQP